MFEHAALLAEVSVHATCVLQGSKAREMVHGMMRLTLGANRDKAVDNINRATLSRHC